MTLTTQAALHWIAEVFEEKPSVVIPSATADDLQGWDSLGMLTLMAELDENNYATFFEYDDDGTLIRLKKETERGIMTIKETRSAMLKDN